MSFDVYISSYKDGEPHGISEVDIRALLGQHVEQVQGFDCWRVRFDCGGSDIYLTRVDGDRSLITGMTVNRPVADQRLWDALYGILSLGNAVLYFPGCRSPLVASRGATRHLPQDMVEALGEPTVICNGADIVAQIESA